MRLWALLFIACVLSAANAKTVNMVHTGDTFCQIVAVDKTNAPCNPRNDTKCTGGVARLATKIQESRDANGEIFLFDSGSFLEGSLFFYEFGPYAAAGYYASLGYNAVLITTRDFYSGVDVLRDFLINSTVPAVASNLDVTDEPRLAGLVHPYLTFTVNGTVVGFTGEIDSNLHLKVASGNAGNTTTTPSIYGLRKAVNTMLDQGVDVIVVALSTSELVPAEVLDEVYGIDVITFKGLNDKNGTTRLHTTPWGSKALIAGVGTYGTRWDHMKIQFSSNGLVQSFIGGSDKLLDSIVPDPSYLTRVLAQWDTIQAAFNTTLGSTAIFLDGTNCELGECSLGDFSADVLRDYAKSTVAITNGGAMKRDIPIGPITLGQLLVALQFDQSNTVSVFTLTGADLFACIENGFSKYDPLNPDGRFPQVSGMQIYWNPTQPVGLRTVRINIQNPDGSYSPLRNTSFYSVATNSFMRSGGDGYTLMQTNAIEPQDFGPFLSNLDIAYLGVNSPLNFAVGNRIIVTSDLRPNPNAVVYDDYYVDWGDYPAIILVILSFLLAVVLFIVLIFMIAAVTTTILKETSISFHVVQLVSMIISCFIIYIFIGTPSDGYCAIRPWTSLLFTLVFGNLVAKQISITVQSVQALLKHENDMVLHVKYNPLLLARNLGPMLVINLIYLILWTAIDYPKAGRENAEGGYNSQLTCRSDPDIPWLVILFIGFALLMLVGIVCSVWLHHVPVMYREADRIGISIYISSLLICLIIIIFNAIRDYQIVAFFILGFGILLTLLAITAIIYFPLCYLIIVKLIRGEKGTGKIDTDFEPEGKDDQLDDL